VYNVHAEIPRITMVEAPTAASSFLMAGWLPRGVGTGNLSRVLMCSPKWTINALDMSPDEIEAKVKEIICNQLEVSAEQLRPEASFIDDLKADSLAVVELVLAFEQEFKITIPEEDTEQIKTVKDATNYIKTHAK
jgi:acyl carrier protein